MKTRSLTALPVYNEVRYVDQVLDRVVPFSPEVLVVDDGSRDGTGELLSARHDIRLVTHPVNRGYGAALITAFEYARQAGYDYLVTLDCDGQHEPQRIPDFIRACREVDVVSGSRYLRPFPGDAAPPDQRRRINRQITGALNRRLGLRLTDAFCGFKCYRVSALAQLQLTEHGYAMPLELWVQAVAAGLRIIEIAVPLIYLDETRSFGGALDDGGTRLQHYRDVLENALEQAGLDERPLTNEVCLRVSR